MLSTDGPGPKRAVFYTRASTEEQARPAYSLTQQIEADEYRATPGAWLRPGDRRAAPKRR
jgi:DNA invertase Pin-like site-specific DNA recombinase